MEALLYEKESSAFGYAVETHDYRGLDLPVDDKSIVHTEHSRMGNGFLTMKEANHILHHLPLKITSVDNSGLFKYFNEVVEASEVMFNRTPCSTGPHVANCPPLRL